MKLSVRYFIKEIIFQKPTTLLKKNILQQNKFLFFVAGKHTAFLFHR